MNKRIDQSGEHRKKTSNAIMRGIDFLASIQEADGSWQGDYGGPMFLLPLYIGTCYITGQQISDHEKKGFIRYYKNIQNSDGSIGLHAEDSGCMFTTVLGLVAMRILGVDRDNPITLSMRKWIQENGTALGAASWGKFFLSLLNLHPYEGLHPLLPELWSLPYAVPIHPGRLWCHARQVYLPMAYLYGTRAKIPENDLIHELRADIYGDTYEDIDFSGHRDAIAPSDNYTPYSRLLKAANRIMAFYENHYIKRWRESSLNKVYDHILYEDRVTNFIDIGPVNSILNTLVHFFADGSGEYFKKSYRALRIYLFEGHDGIKINGYNSTALWDTAFTVQSIFAADNHANFRTCVDRAFRYIRNNQVLEDVPDKKIYFRHACRGGWPFSDRAHGWPITDCTAEGFKAASLIMDSGLTEDSIPEDLMRESVELILSFQNSDGGWATYERRRGPYWLERLNPSSVFGNIMLDYSFVECSSSCIQALARAQSRFDQGLNRRIKKALKKGCRFLKKMQRRDGSFEGSWAVCFTYGTWFGVWGLLDAGLPQDAPELRKACEFLISHQNSDGGWGESYRSCREGKWIDHEESQVVNTSWALMTLVRAGMARSESAHRAANFLIDRQMGNGDWPRESMVGVFNKTTLINYENYRRYFPVWALGLYNNSM